MKEIEFLKEWFLQQETFFFITGNFIISFYAPLICEALSIALINQIIKSKTDMPTFYRLIISVLSSFIPTTFLYVVINVFKIPLRYIWQNPHITLLIVLILFISTVVYKTIKQN